MGDTHRARGATIDIDHRRERLSRRQEIFESLRSAPYVVNRGKRGIELDSSRFGQVADVLYHECGWEPYQIRSRLKHYEGWDRHDWT